MAKVEFMFLDRETVRSLLPDTRTLLEIVEGGLAAHGRREVVLPPKSHLELDDRFNGHFNILPGYVAPADAAGVKVIGDYVDNYRVGLPSEIALLTLYDPRTGAPRALLDATQLTWLRTGAVTGVGARHLARADTRIVGHVGARGTAFGNLQALASMFELEEIRIASKRKETREALARMVEEKLQVRARPVDTVEAACRDAHIVIEATRLERPQVLVEDAWLQPGSLLVTYGVAIVITLLLVPLFPFKEPIGRELRKINWASAVIGAAIVGVELGFLLAYRAGWRISVGSAAANAAVAVLLVPAGLLFFGEKLSEANFAGLVLCVAGLLLVVMR